MLVVFDRFDYWQVGYVFPKGQYQELRAAGLEQFRRSIVELESRFAEHVAALTDWHQCSLLSVESSRCPVWFKPGLLLIGDAAHVMSPVGGVGINYAIQDAVVTVNVLADKLRDGEVRVEDLATVQRERQWPTRAIQAVQSFVQQALIANVLSSQTTVSISVVRPIVLPHPVPERYPRPPGRLRRQTGQAEAVALSPANTCPDPADQNDETRGAGRELINPRN